MLQALVQFATQELALPSPQDDTPLVEVAAELLRQLPLLLVLDGLEVLQERPGTVAYGVLLEDDLRALLEKAYHVRHDGLVLLTSRFPFADLMPYLGRGLQALELDQLTPVEGAALLERCEVGGTTAERGAVSQRLEGHALGLRVFAAALAAQADGDPTRLVTQLFDEPGLRQDEPLERKLRHLLAFYEQHLTPVRTALLGLVSLFRTPVDEATIRTLVYDLSAVQAILGELSEAELHRELQGLCHEHLLRPEHTAYTEAYTCHPILRDHFRHRLLARDQAVAGKMADLIAEQPDAGRAESLRELEPVLTAIELLLDAGAFERASYPSPYHPIILSPSRAVIMAEAGMSKQDTQAWLHRQCRVSLHAAIGPQGMPTDDEGTWRTHPELQHLANDPTATIPALESPEHYLLFVTGGSTHYAHFFYGTYGIATMPVEEM